ncbi:hypothetical protein Tco_0132805 [Tanacetum coccineum]
MKKHFTPVLRKSNKGRMKNLVIRNNITQIKANGEAFKNDQYILATQVKQCFYLEDMARQPLGWKVVEHVSQQKFSNGGVIVVEDDPDVIHVNNSSDLALSTSLNDLEIAALHIDASKTCGAYENPERRKADVGKTNSKSRLLVCQTLATPVQAEENIWTHGFPCMCFYCARGFHKPRKFKRHARGCLESRRTLHCTSKKKHMGLWPTSWI